MSRHRSSLGRRWPRSSAETPRARRRTGSIAAALGMDAFNDQEPRDKKGEWTTGVGTVSPEEQSRSPRLHGLGQ